MKHYFGWLRESTIVLGAAVASLMGAHLAAAPGLQPGDRIAICGDSITEQKLYSVQIESYLLACQPVPVAEVHQFGSGGETAVGLARRIPTNVLPFKPTVVTTVYGMNDGGYLRPDAKRLALFEQGLESVVSQFKGAGVSNVLIGTPGVVDTFKFKAWRMAQCTPEEYNETLFQLGQSARKLAAKHGVTWVDVHTPMMEAMAKAKAKYGEQYPLAEDGVHPSYNGHLVMAYAFLKAMGVDGDIGRLNLDMKTGSATASDGHKVLSASSTSMTIQSTRYPYCFTDDPTSPQASRNMLECVPFNETLNRFVLAVSNAPAPHMKVTWGKQSKVFRADQLSAGINLAAEFLDNPFSTAFAEVEKAVRAQQAYETPAVKTLLSSLPVWEECFPEKRTDFHELHQAVIGKVQALNRQAVSAVKPVVHTLELSPAEAGQFSTEGAESVPNPQSSRHPDEPAPRTGRPGWMEQHESYVALASKGEIDLLFIGDSITKCWAREGKEVWREKFAPLRAANFGISGDSVEHVLWRVKHGELMGIKPKGIVLLIGTNNITKRDSPPEIVRGISAVIGEIRRVLPETRIVLIGVLPRRESASHPDREVVQEINRLLAGLEVGDPVSYLDIGSAFLAPEGNMEKELTTDFVHLTVRGYQKFADAILPLLTDLLRTSSRRGSESR